MGKKLRTIPKRKMTPDPADQVQRPCKAYEAMSQKWDLLHDLIGGTLAMRAAREKWLPREPNEEQYDLRLRRSVLFNAYGDTLTRLANKPFMRPIVLKEENSKLPAKLAGLKENCDGTGRSITAFFGDVFKAGVNYGLTHVLVDYPTMPPGATLADENKAGAKPTFSHITPPNLIGWRVSVVDGHETLTQIRIKEEVEVWAGEFGTETKHRVRVFNAPTPGIPQPTFLANDSGPVVIDPNPDGLGVWELWQKIDDNTDGEEQYEKIDTGTYTYPGIPLLTFYTNRTKILEGNPPLEDLAWMNLVHWQSSSDHRNILRFARIGILFAKNFGNDLSGGLTIGPNRLVYAKSADADLKYVEYSGGAIDAGRTDLLEIKADMQVLGLKPLVTKSGDETATGKSIDEANSQSDIQTWCRSLERYIKACFETAAIWVGEDLPEEFAADVFNDFGITSAAARDMTSLVQARLARQISHETFLREMKRRGVLAEDLSVSEEIERINAEPPPDDTNGGGGGDDPNALPANRGGLS